VRVAPRPPGAAAATTVKRLGRASGLRHVAPAIRLPDLDLGDSDRLAALRDIAGHQGQRLLLARGLEIPPDLVAAGEAGADRRAVTKRAGKALPGGEGGAALVCLVPVVE
jgi:hypothetical protein